MILVFDVGNTNITCGLFDTSGKLEHSFRLQTNPRYTADELGMFVSQALTHRNVPLESISGIFIGSVVPSLTRPLQEMSLSYFKKEALCYGAENVDPGLPIYVDQKRNVGADIIANVVAAYELYKKALIVVDFGTATTFDLVDKEGGYHGTSIAPGIMLSLRALHGSAALLPSVSFDKPEKVIGTNTVDCMRSGMYYGYVSLTEGMIRRIREEAKDELIVVGTGGFAPLIASATNCIDHLEGALTLQGLYYLYQRNA